MSYRRILVTGGAGFIGAHLALALKAAYPGAGVMAFDNLSRRGSELALERLAAGGVAFVKGDLCDDAALDALPDSDLVIDAAAEPSVQAGLGGGLAGLLTNNLTATQKLLTRVATKAKAFIFLSTSRVYSIPGLAAALELKVEGKRFVPTRATPLPGLSEEGVGTAFSTLPPRSYYGSSKLASELLVEELCFGAGVPFIINRCSCIAGPWQMGKTDQGFLALWLARHLYKQPLAYRGFGGWGHQVRDLLHVNDLVELILDQAADPVRYGHWTYNVGGGRKNALSLAELTEQAAALGGTVEIGSIAETHPFDVPWYVTDNTDITAVRGWVPRRGLDQLIGETWTWLSDNKALLASILGDRS